MRNTIKTKVIAGAIGLIIGPIAAVVTARAQVVGTPRPDTCDGNAIGTYCATVNGQNKACYTCADGYCNENCRDSSEDAKAKCTDDYSYKCGGAQ